MKKLSKNLAMYICMFVAVLCVMTLRAEAANVTSGTLGDNGGFTYTYDADTKTLTITGEDSGLRGYYDQTQFKIVCPFTDICEDVEIINLKNCTIKGSAEYMFEALKSLKSVQFQNVNTSNVTSMEGMFRNCTSLSSLDLSGLDTGNVTSMHSMFSGCSNLKNLNLSGLNTGKVTTMSFMFRNCTSLSSLDLKSFNTGNVTSMYWMFYDCHSLSSLNVSSFNTANVTSMSGMFFDCRSLSSLNISNFNTGKVTSMDEMFYNCRSLSSLNVSSFNTANVTTMSEMFRSCSGLSSLDVSNFNTEKVTSMSSMFFDCSGLSSLDLSNFNTGALKYTSNMFSNCMNLVSIKTPKAISETVSIYLPATFANPKNERTTYITKDFANTTLTNVNYLVSKIVLNTSSLTVHMGKTDQLTATVSPEKALDKSLTWKSSNTAVAKVDANGKVTPVAPGTATITATATDISGVSASCSVTVIQPVTGIALNKTSLSLKTGAAETLTITVSPSNASNKAVTWKSSNTAVATVDSNGKVTAVGPGTATITATTKDGSGKSASCSVTVTQPVTGITLSKTSASIKVGGSETLTVTVSPSNASNKAVTWKSSNTAVATVDSNGKVTAVGGGTATITATAKDGSGKSASCSVTVIQPVTGIALNKTSTSIKVGGSEILTVTVSPSNATNKAVTWKSSNTLIATVDANGKVTAVGPGTATITATAKDGSGKSASCSVTVTQPVTGITLNKTTMNLKTGATETLTVTVSPGNASNKAVTWKSSDTAVATVDANGKVTAVGRGTASITATAKDGSGKSASCSVTVTQPVTGITMNKTSTSIKVGGSETLTVTVSPGNANNKAVTWKSSNTAVATVDSSGKVTAVAVGTATISATAKDGSGKSASCSVTVIQPVTGITLNKTTMSLKTGATEALTVTVSPSNATNKAVTWKSSDTAVATVDANGKVTAVGRGTASITATAKDGSGKSASCSVTVTQPVTGITLNKTTMSLKIGATETLTVTVSPSNANNKAVTWKSSNTAVATVDANGKVTAVAVGTATISATAKDGSGKSASCSVTVIRPVTGITLNKTSLDMNTGTSETLTVTVSPGNATNKAVTWKSSNTAVATVDANGKVTAVGRGTATITVTAKDGSGKSASCSVRVMTEQERQIRVFVERMYTIVLGRDAEEQGLNDWTERLMAKEIDGATLVDMFVGSDEFINRNTSDEEYIKILYRAVLGREADADGLKMWKDMLADDWTRDYILEGLVLSTEFKNICDSYGIIAAFEPTAESQVRSFVKRMYTVVLNRRADAVGLEDWTRQLMNGTANGAQLADGFISSDEFVNRNLSNEKYIKVLYRAFFNREADEGGFNVWMNELAKGTSRRDVMKGFVHSVEFSDLCAQYGIIRGEIQ